MAFGKDPSNRSRLTGTFTQQAAYASRKRGGGGGGKRAYWADNYRPTADINGDMIRVIPGDYPHQEVDDASGELFDSTLAWVQVTEHYHGGLKKGALCSGGPFRRNRSKRSLCHGCEMYWEDYQQREYIRQTTGQRVNNPRRVGMSDKYVFTVMDYGVFYKADQLDNQGRVRTNSQGVPFTEWKKLQYQNDPAAAGRETKRGHVMAWPINKSDFETLKAYVESSVALSCMGCGDYGKIIMDPASGRMMQEGGVKSIQYTCCNCKAPIIDRRTSTLSPQQIDDLYKAPVQCQHCGFNGFMDEVVHCDKCAAQGTTPARASLWDVDLQVRLQKNPQDTTKNQLMILNHSQPRPIHPDQSYLDQAKPMDLISIFAPTPPEEQRRLWNIPEPGRQQQMQTGIPGGPGMPGMMPGMPAQPGMPMMPHAVPYGQQPQQPVPVVQTAPPTTAPQLAGYAPPAGYPPPGYPPAGTNN